MINKSDFADEWFNDQDLDFYVQNIDYLENGLIQKWIKIKENDQNITVGEYVTLSFHSMDDAKNRTIISNQLVEILTQLCKDVYLNKVLVVGLGNEEMVSDSIGPKTIHQILVSAHLFELNENIHPGINNCAAIAPKVMGQTGLESAKIVKAIADIYKPNIVLVVDALSSDSMTRINKAIQISNIGIIPGSGVGNHRLAINEETMHVPVISIGVATVITINSILKELKVDLEYNNSNCIITPRSMDIDCKHIISILSNAINCFIHPGYEEL